MVWGAALALLCVVALQATDRGRPTAREQVQQAKNSEDHGLSRGSASALPLSRFGLEFPDLTTSFADAKLRVIVDGSGIPVEETALAQLADGIRLVHWPGRSEVKATKAVHNATRPTIVRSELSPEELRDVRASYRPVGEITLEPASDLKEGWYALEATVIPDGFARPELGRLIELSDGGVAARFRVGSEPMVVDIRVCDLPSGRQRVYVEYSEQLEGTEAGFDLQRTDPGPDLKCVALSKPSDAHPDSRASGTRSVLECAALPARERLRLQLKPSVRTPGGEQPTKRELAFSLDAMKPWGPGCKVQWADGPQA